MTHAMTDEGRGMMELPPKLTLDALAERTGLNVDTLRTYLYRGRAAPAPARRLVAAALRRYAREVEATARRLEGGAYEP